MTRTSHRSTEDRARMSGPPVVLADPPAYMREVPSSALVGPKFSADAIVGALARRGVYVRPSLAAVEAERARRGMRGPGIVLGDAAEGGPDVLPTLGDVSPMLREVLGLPRDYDVPTSEAARANRARVEDALNGRRTEPP